MAIIVLIGAIYMLVTGGLGQCILYIAVVAFISNKYTDNHRRGGWWK